MEPTWNACLQTLVGHESSVSSVAFSADGRWLASASEDGTAKIWDSANGSCVLTLYDVCKSDNGRLKIFSWGIDGAVAFSANSFWLAWGSSRGTIHILDLATRTFLHTMSGHTRGISSVVFSRDNSKIASTSLDKTTKIWDARKGICLHTLRDQFLDVRPVAFSVDDWLATVSNSMAVTIWDAATGACVKTLRAHDQLEWPRSVAFSPDGCRLVSVDTSHVHVWNIGTCERLLKFGNDGNEKHWSAAFSANSRLIATASGDRINLWDIDDGTLVKTIKRPNTFFRSLSFSPDTQRLVSASNDGIVRVWDISRIQAHTFESHHTHEKATSVSFSADGRRFATAASPESVKIWSTSTGNVLQTLGYKGIGEKVSFSTDNRLASTSSSRGFKIWNTETGSCVQSIDYFEKCDRSGTLIADGKQLASASSGLIQIWDVMTGDCLHTLGNHKKCLGGFVKASTGGQWLAYSADGKTIRFWNTVNGIEVLSLEDHAKQIRSVAFSADDRRLASASSDALKIWDVETGTCVQTITNHLDHWNPCLSFDTNHHTRLHTRFGFLDLDLLPEHTPRGGEATNKVCYRGYGVDINHQETWVLRDGGRVLRLPPEYVPLYDAFASCMNGSVFAWVSSSGRVFRMRVSTREYNV